MNPTQFAKWCERYSIPVAKGRYLRKLIGKRVKEQERACNGDPHPLIADRDDKNASSDAWRADSDATDHKIDALARELGFTRVDFGVGLYPAMEKGEETCIMVP